MNDSLKYEKEILEIKSVIQEEIELTFYQSEIQLISTW